MYIIYLYVVTFCKEHALQPICRNCLYIVHVATKVFKGKLPIILLYVRRWIHVGACYKGRIMMKGDHAEPCVNVLNGGNDPYHTAPARAAGHRYLNTYKQTLSDNAAELDASC